MTFYLGVSCWECQSSRHLGKPSSPCICRLDRQEDLRGPGMALSCLLGPEGGPVGLESRLRIEQRGVGTTKY